MKGANLFEEAEIEVKYAAFELLQNQTRRVGAAEERERYARKELDSEKAMLERWLAMDIKDLAKEYIKRLKGE